MWCFNRPFRVLHHHSNISLLADADFGWAMEYFFLDEHLEFGKQFNIKCQWDPFLNALRSSLEVKADALSLLKMKRTLGFDSILTNSSVLSAQNCSKPHWMSVLSNREPHIRPAWRMLYIYSDRTKTCQRLSSTPEKLVVCSITTLK